MTDLRRRYLRSVIGIAGGLAVALTIIALIEPSGDEDNSGRLANTGVSQRMAPASSSEMRGGDAAVMSLHDTPRAVPELAFRDGNGRLTSLGDFQGKVVLLNIWATWCGPCREEMPTLDRLQAELGGPDFQVVALSIDRAGLGVVSEFYDEIGIGHLAKYIDESGKASRQINAVGLPTTLLIDREGREIARHVGPAEWDTPEMVSFFRQQLGRKSGALRPGPAAKGADARARLPAPGHTTSLAITKGKSS